MSISKKNAEGYLDSTAYEAVTAVHKKETAKDRPYRPLVFICSPFAGDVEQNIENARRYSRFAVEQGAIPIAPHLLFPQFLDDSSPKERNLGIQFGKVLLSKCNEIWMFGETASSGMKQELARAQEWGKLVRFFRTDCEVRQ